MSDYFIKVVKNDMQYKYKYETFICHYVCLIRHN